MSNELIILDGIIEDNRSAEASDMSMSDYFEMVVAKQSTKQYNLNNDQLLDGIVGGSGDGGIDAFYIFVNDSPIEEDTTPPEIRSGIRLHLVIAQASRAKGFGESALDNFHSFSENAFDFSVDPNVYRRLYNEAVSEKITLFRDLYRRYARSNPTLKISYFYGTRATEKPSVTVNQKKERLISRVNSLFSGDVCVLTFLGASALLELVRQRPKTNFKLKLAENPITPPNNNINLVGLVSLSDYFDFISNDNNQLRPHIFEANVRDYQTSSPINGQILDTLQGTHDDDFWWLNNGITILSTNVSMSFNSKVLNIDNPEIVNGLQTSQEIFNYFSQRIQSGDKDLNDDRNLLVRVIVCEHENSRNRIILATNSQNKIPIDALKSKEEIHRNIEDHLRRYEIYYDRRRNHWKLQGKPIARILTPMKLGQALQSIMLYDPKTAKEKPSLVFKNGNEDRHNAIFSLDYDIDVYRFCAELLLSVEAILKSDVIGSALEKRAVAQVKFHALTHVVIRASNTTDSGSLRVSVLSQQDIPESTLIDSLQRVLAIFEGQGPHNITSKSGEFLDAVLDDAKSMII